MGKGYINAYGQDGQVDSLKKILKNICRKTFGIDAAFLRIGRSD
jgi:hypothetical protein